MRQWHRDLGAWIAPTTRKIVIARSVEVETKDRVVRHDPFLIAMRLGDTPPVLAQDVGRASQEVTHTGNP